MQYPEHEKLRARRDEHIAISEFLEWLEDNGHSITHYGTARDDTSGRRIPLRSNPKDLISVFFGIDQQAYSEEKTKMIDALKN